MAARRPTSSGHRVMASLAVYANMIADATGMNADEMFAGF
jgi:hypothetical protein